MTESAALDFYLVLTGPRAAVSTRSSARPWQTDAVYLFHAGHLLEQQHARNIKIGVATSVLTSQWETLRSSRSPVTRCSRERRPACSGCLPAQEDRDAGGEDPDGGAARD
jgi:hypothetical protein